MKQLILSVLKNGYTTSKKALKDFTNYLYPLKHILQVNCAGWVACNDNDFWKIENQQNRLDLMGDIMAIHKASVTDHAYFHILNRFENGDKYGIC